MAVTRFLARMLAIAIRTETAASVAITSSSIADPTVITTGTAHGLTSGDTVTIAGHADSVPDINGEQVVTVLTSTTFSIPIEVTTGGTGGTVLRPDGFTAINGLNSLTHSDSSVDADTTGFDSDGHEESMVAQRGETWTLAGFKLLDTANGDQDPGQEAVEELAREIGPASVGLFRLTYPGGGTETFSGTAKFTKPGGGNNDPAAWSVALKVTGAPAYGSPA